MIKWFAYIVVLLIFVPWFSYARLKNHNFPAAPYSIGRTFSFIQHTTDTVIAKNKKQEAEDKRKIKEVTRAKKQPKPEKVEPPDNTRGAKKKAKRQRRPVGLERPPEIPRRNGN